MEKMKNFAGEYRTLIANILNEVATILNNQNVDEFTLFEGHPYDEPNREKNIPQFSSYWVCDEMYYRTIQKLVKCNGMWGFVLYDEYEQTALFPQELLTNDMDFKCANDLYEIVFNHFHPKRVRTHEPKVSNLLGDLAKELEEK
jgi:hypothetical protein